MSTAAFDRATTASFPGCLAALVSERGQEVPHRRQLFVKYDKSSKHKSAMARKLTRHVLRFKLFFSPYKIQKARFDMKYVRFFHVIAGVALWGLLAAPGEGMASDKGGSAVEARKMIEHAAAAVREDKARALEAFTAGAEGFKDRDLYVFCGDPEGMITAHGGDPSMVGLDSRQILDKNGTNLGDLFYETAEKDKIKTVEYVWPRPGETEPVTKRSYVIRVGDQMCGVGYYE